MDLKVPEPYVTLQIVGVQNLPGRKHQHVRVFGVNPDDPEAKVVEIALDPDDAVDLIHDAHRDGTFPEIEVPARAVVKVLNTREIDIVRMQHPPNNGPDYRGGA